MRVRQECLQKDLEEPNVQSSLDNNFLSKFFVVNTLTNDCCLKCESFDQSEQFNLSANAKYGESFESGKKSFAFLRKGLISDSEINLILSLNMDNIEENSLSERCVLDSISDLYFSNSENIFLGATNLSLLDKNNSAVFESLINAENNIFASTTSNIYFSCFNNFLYFFDKALLTCLPNLNASSFVNSLSSVNDFNTANCNNFLLNASLATADQFSSGNSSILCLIFCGTDKVMVGILNTSLYVYYVYYVQIYKALGSYVLRGENEN